MRHHVHKNTCICFLFVDTASIIFDDVRVGKRFKKHCLLVKVLRQFSVTDLDQLDCHAWWQVGVVALVQTFEDLTVGSFTEGLSPLNILEIRHVRNLELIC